MIWEFVRMGLVLFVVFGCSTKDSFDDDDDGTAWDQSDEGTWSGTGVGGGGSQPQTSYCEAICDWAVDCAGDV